MPRRRFIFVGAIVAAVTVAPILVAPAPRPASDRLAYAAGLHTGDVPVASHVRPVHHDQNGNPLDANGNPLDLGHHDPQGNPVDANGHPLGSAGHHHDQYGNPVDVSGNPLHFDNHNGNVNFNGNDNH